MVSAVASWTVVLAGLWIAAGPFVLGYQRESVSVAHDLIVGILILALGTTNLIAKTRSMRPEIKP